MTTSESHPNPYEFYVVVPDRFGGAVIAVGDLMDALLGDDPIDEALENGSIDMFAGTREHLARIQALNLDGNASAYWNLT